MTVRIYSVVFDWDDGNRRKNQIKHDVSPEECEQIFLNEPLLLLDDAAHSLKEVRSFALGRTNRDRRLSISFTLRNERIRVISARPMSKTERTAYENA